MDDWLGQRVGVYGFGKTGKACVSFLTLRLITPVVFIDAATDEQKQAMRSETDGRLELVFGDEILRQIEYIDSLILSPGVALTNPNVLRARERGIPVISELELAARNCSGYVIAVTGTNGKSTTTKMLGHVLSALGPAHVVGNIGTPFLANLDVIGRDDFVALEVSSFQLEAVERFAPRIAIYTNMTPDHLDRHGTMEEYPRIKRSMTDRMKQGDYVITNAHCAEFAPDRFLNQLPSFLQYRSTPGNRLHGAWAANNKLNIDLGQEQYEIPQECIKLPGLHNVENALAVVLAALVVGATPDTIAERLSSFTGYEHRIELCRRAAGISFYNDSKATNPEATITALKAMDGPLALILGGRDKLTALDEMISWIQRKVKHVVLLGEAAERFAKELSTAGYNAYERVDDMEQALAAAVEAVRASGGSVLLSPACASFDQYPGYEARGEHFKELTAKLEL